MRKFLAASVALLVLAGCGGSSDSGSSGNYSGTYTVLISGEYMSLQIVQSGGAATFHLVGTGTDVTGAVLFKGKDASLSGPIDDGMLLSEITFTDNGKSFAGTWSLSSTDGASGPISGTKGASSAETYDLDANGIPKFVGVQYIELNRIASISKFRSGQGHDYSDDFESCRSMKHYYRPPENDDWTTIKVYAPVSGAVIDNTLEWAGTKLSIQSTDYPAFTFVLFHVNVSPVLSVGDMVAAGQQIGTHISNETSSDIAVRVRTPAGNRLISYLEVLTDTAFSVYHARGQETRAQAIITKEERDADPLSCSGETFADQGDLVNTVTFD